MQVGIRGEVSLRIIDRVTGEVETKYCLNLITKYGLKRLLAPKNLADKVATHICVGYRTDEVSVDDDIVPANYCVIEANETLNVTSVAKDSSTSTWNAIFSATMPVGFRFNHMHLAHKDADGILRPLTSLKLYEHDGTEVDYTHTERYRIGVQYSIIFNLGTVAGTSTYVKSATLASNNDMYYLAPYINSELNGLGKYYESSSGTPTSYIKSHDGYFNEAGNWVQIYNIVLGASSYSTSAIFKLGVTALKLNTTSGRGNEEIELKFEVKPMPEEYFEAKPVTSITIKPLANAYYEEDTRYVLIKGPAYQTVEVYYGKYLVTSFYLGSTGEHHRTSRINQMTDITTGVSVNNDIDYLLSSGVMLRFVTKTRTGVAEVTLQAPDLTANDVHRIWFIGPTTLRAVSNYGDKITVKWDPDQYNNDTYDRVTNPNIGTCTTVFPENTTYYYTDIELTGFDSALHKYIEYSCTDAAGNVYPQGRKRLYNYIPGVNYSNDTNDGYEPSLRRTLPMGEIDKYTFSLFVISGDIT